MKMGRSINISIGVFLLALVVVGIFVSRAYEQHVEQQAVKHLNLAKFADVRALFEAPQGDDEETIAKRLKAANMYRLTPSWIRLIDNSRWFGYKFELDFTA